MSKKKPIGIIGGDTSLTKRQINEMIQHVKDNPVKVTKFPDIGKSMEERTERARKEFIKQREVRFSERIRRIFK
jgi:alpha-galactosidase/6-phospho-beta-glucosidase family protein